MTLSKKHFKKIAKLIKENSQVITDNNENDIYKIEETRYIKFSEFVAGLSEFFREENKNFNLTKFMDACIK